MHITDGNEHEERLVKIMGGIVIETESEKLISQGMLQGQAKMIIELNQEAGKDDEVILKQMKENWDCLGKKPLPF